MSVLEIMDMVDGHPLTLETLFIKEITPVLNTKSSLNLKF